MQRERDNLVWKTVGNSDLAPISLQHKQMRLRRGETVPALSPHRLASLLPVRLAGDHLRRPHSALGLPAHAPSRKPTAPLRVRRSSRGLTADRCDSRRTSAYDMLIHQRCSSGPYSRVSILLALGGAILELIHWKISVPVSPPVVSARTRQTLSSSAGGKEGWTGITRNGSIAQTHSILRKPCAISL